MVGLHLLDIGASLSVTGYVKVELGGADVPGHGLGMAHVLKVLGHQTLGLRER